MADAPIARIASYASQSATSSQSRYHPLPNRRQTSTSSRSTTKRSTSVRSAVDVPLRHPTPDLQSLQGAYTRNVTRLEESAEAMSQGGSDIGEEIKKMNEAERVRSASRGQGDGVEGQLSRQNSIQSSHHGEISVVGWPISGAGLGRMDTGRSRTSSYANSIVDVNGAARWGGYSPGGFIQSPVESMRSGSWSHGSTSAVNRAPTSGSKGSSRLAQMIEPTQEGRPLDSPLAPSLSSASHPSQPQQPSRQNSQSSFAKRYDQIAGQITEQLEEVPPSPSKDDLNRKAPLAGQIEHTDHPASTHVAQEQQMHEELGEAMDEAFAGDATPERPRSADTFQQAQLAFKDFDGVHFDPEAEEFVEVDGDGHEISRVSARTSSGTLSMDPAMAMIKQADRPISMGAPPPQANMVYYPAPVPRMLNLPKRLSQLPSADVQAKRRSQVLGHLAPGARQSAPWLSQTDLSVHSAGDGARPGSQQSGSYARPDSKHSGTNRDFSAEQRPAFPDEHPASLRPGSNRGSHHSGSASSPQSHHTRQPSNAPRGLLNERMSMANLPPQLRASTFFEHQSVPQDVEIQGESAVATLDNILQASATAPVSAFTDHPYGGPQPKSLFGLGKKTRNKSSTTLDLTGAEAPPSPETAKKKSKARSALAGLLRRNSSGDKLQEAMMKNNSSRSSMILDLNDGGRKLQKRKSQLSFSAMDELETARSRMGTPGPSTPGETPALEKSEPQFATGGLVGAATNAERDEGEVKESTARKVSNKIKNIVSDGDQIEADFNEAEEQEELSDEEPVYAAPTTLLAELQVRKAQQKGRNRTAATAYPQGMHSTLLELDAVEEVSKRRRKEKKIRLAWEDPVLVQQEAEHGDEDDDVPLGMLFPAKDGPITKKLGDERDWSRPLGLMEKRELEDSEPLSSRRNRLRGLSPVRKDVAQQAGITTQPNGSRVHLAGQPDAPPEIKADDEEAGDLREGETLGERRQRMKIKNTLDGALSDVAPEKGSRPVSTFTDDVLSQFGGLGVNHSENRDETILAAKGAASPANGDEEGETLAQRRARLAREREMSGGSGGERPGLRSSASLANLLSANPVGQRGSAKELRPQEGTLLHASAAAKEQQRAQLASSNTRFLTGASQPLVDPRPATSRADFTGGQGTQLGKQGMQSSASTPLFGAGPQSGAYFTQVPPKPQARMASYNNGMGGYNPSMGVAAYQPSTGMVQQAQQPAMNTSAYAALTGGGAAAANPSTMMMPSMQSMPSLSRHASMMGMPMSSGMGTGAFGNVIGAPAFNRDTIGSFGVGLGAPAGPLASQAMRPIGYGGGTGGQVEEAAMDAGQRAAIDQWRLSIAPS